jgi:signal transduction histidine kinase
MLDYSREKTPIRREVHVANLIGEVLDTVAYKAEQKTVTLSKEVAPGCDVICVDSDQIFRCLLNLVENAIDAVGAGDGRVHTQCCPVSQVEARGIFGEDAVLETMGTIVRLSVIDNGFGIDPEHLPSIFLPFFSTKASKGTGLGLAVTRKLVEEHGGKVLVDSKKGQGTAFHLVLPERNSKDREDSAVTVHDAAK